MVHSETGQNADRYTVLPFQFMRLQGRTLLVNQCGEYLFVSNEDFQRFVEHRLEANEGVFLDLAAKHFLATKDPNLAVQLLATKYRTKKSFLRNFTALHMIVVTVRCNQRCRYCQATSEAADAARFDMQPETATKAVDLVFRSASPCVKIEFQGGEPLLNFQVVRHIVEYAEQLNRKAKKDLEFVICTNLTAVEDHQLEFCKEHGVVISMSLDGPREIHNACRRMADGEGSYDPVMAGLEKARKYMGDRIAAMMTTTRSSLMRFREVVDEYLRDGFRSIFLRSLNPYGRAVSNRSELQYPMEEFIASYKDGLDYIIELNLRGIPFVEEYASLILMRMLTPFATGFVDLQSPTGAGIGGVIYDYDGSVYVSDEGRMLARSGDRTFRMGSVLENTYEELFGGEVIRRTVDASCVECLPQCRDCAFQMWCGADPVRNYATQHDMIGHRPTSEFCKKNKPLIQLLLELVERGNPEIQDVLWSWITRRPVDAVRALGCKESTCGV